MAASFDVWIIAFRIVAIIPCRGCSSWRNAIGCVARRWGRVVVSGIIIIAIIIVRHRIIVPIGIAIEIRIVPKS